MSFCRVRDYHWHLPLERARMMIAFLLGALGLIYMTTYLAAEETSQLARHCNWLVSWTVDIPLTSGVCQKIIYFSHQSQDVH